VSAVRARRAGEALLAGDARTAQDDLAVLLPDPTALGPTRAANERLAPLAPILYARALASKDPVSRRRDIEAAWRLAPPPEPQRRAVAQAAVELEREPLIKITRKLTQTFKLDDTLMEEVRGTFVGCGRAHAIDPTLTTSNEECGALYVLRGLLAQVKDMRKVWAPRLLEVWPENPVLLFLDSVDRVEPTRTERAAAVAILYRAIRSLPEPPPDQVDTYRFLANDVCQACFDRFERERQAGGALDTELDTLRLCVAKADYSQVWGRLAREHGQRHEFDKAWDCFRHAESTLHREGERPSPEEIASLRVDLLSFEGKLDEALTIARAAPRDTVWGVRLLAEALVRLQRWDEVLALFDPAKVDDARSLRCYGFALVAAGRLEEARALLGRIDHGSPYWAEVRAAIDAKAR
jgi:hypothetical protein